MFKVMYGNGFMANNTFETADDAFRWIDTLSERSRVDSRVIELIEVPRPERKEYIVLRRGVVSGEYYTHTDPITLSGARRKISGYNKLDEFKIQKLVDIDDTVVGG